jgi:prolyl 4-hydroxylase
MKLSLLLVVLVAGKDDGFDYEEKIVPEVDWAKEGPKWAETIYNQAFEYGEEWSPQDLQVINMNKGINTRQPGTVPRFTEEGFKKMPIPKRLYSQIKGYLDRNTQHQQKEYNIAGYLNNNRVATYMINIDENIRHYVFTEMRQILEKWIDNGIYKGDTKLASSACYGIRRYMNGSTLQSHVDRGDTHAVSAILHIDDDKEQDWPLQILDHAGKLNQVLIQPGEMVLYESAKLIHGRPTPFVGKRYDNLFVHYRPSNGWPLAR